MAPAAAASVPPGGGKIVWSTLGGAWVANSDGTNKVRVPGIGAAPHCSLFCPNSSVWAIDISPDEKSVAYIALGSAGDIKVQALSGGPPRRVYTGATGGPLRFSFDGTRLAWGQGQSIRLDGTDFIAPKGNLHDAGGYFLDWTPNGRLLYWSTKGCAYQIHSANIRGGVDRTLTTGNVDIAAASMSDGRFIFDRRPVVRDAFGCEFADNRTIYVANSSGTGLHKVISARSCPPQDIAVSTDRRYVFYSSCEVGNNVSWYRIGIDGTGKTPLAFLDKTTLSVSWSKPLLPCALVANNWPHRIVNGFSTPTGKGYWLTYADGSVGAHGNAVLKGSAACVPLRGPIVGGATHPAGSGYWLVSTDGGIFTYGSAKFFGSMGGTKLNQPVFSMAPTKSGNGYWLVSHDGGIFSFGDAHFYGSTGAIALNQPIAGIIASPTGHGYRMVATDGGIFSFGDVRFYGSLPGIGLHVADVVGMAPTPSGKGYWIARSNGQLFAFGDARYFGNAKTSPGNPINSIFSNPKAQGYRLVTASGATIPFGAAPG